MPQVLCWNMAALCIAVLYYVWRDKLARSGQRDKVLRERVAYMLWCAAQAA